MLASCVAHLTLPKQCHLVKNFNTVIEGETCHTAVQNTYKMQLQEERGYFDSRFIGGTVGHSEENVAARAQCTLSCHIHSQEAESAEYLCPAGLLFSLSRIQTMNGAATFRVGLPTSANLLQTIPHRHTEVCFHGDF